MEIDERISEIVGTNEEYIYNFLQGEETEKDIKKAINQLPKQCKAIFCLSRFDLRVRSY